jgi:leucyl/phenylalanyl-tRNA--protein transferase
VEVFQGGARVGGLYGLAMGAAFFGESMFHTARDASKVALVALARRCATRGDHFIDCQAMTPHLARMGAEAVPRVVYLRMLADALAVRSEPGRWADDPTPHAPA